MTLEEIIEVMAKSEGLKVKCSEKDGDQWTGEVDAYESEYDNEGDESEGDSICVRRDDGSNVIVYADEIENIAILGESAG